jgi:hypothetical protein
VWLLGSSSNHTHLAYVLELPEEIGEVQEAFNISKEGSYIVTVKNPSAGGPVGLAYATPSILHFPRTARGESLAS